MVSKNLKDIKKKYAISKHHAWAGSILLAILLAIRIFLENYEINIDDNFFLAIGISILIYISISLIFTMERLIWQIWPKLPGWLLPIMDILETTVLLHGGSIGLHEVVATVLNTAESIDCGSMRNTSSELT